MPEVTDRPDHLGLIKNTSKPEVEPPKLLKHIQQASATGCERLLAQMFSTTDDLFYDLSKRASSNNEANLYFEAMREIRIKREGVAAYFLQSILRNFALLAKPGAINAAEKPDKIRSTRGLSIVEGDDLEIDLARSNMISRTEALYTQELYDLTMRLDHMLLQVNVDEDNNPLAPALLVDNFIKACNEKLNVDIKALLILFKLFEKHLLKQLGHVYAEANQALKDAGILPVVPKYLDRKAKMESPETSLDDIPTLRDNASNNRSAEQSTPGNLNADSGSHPHDLSNFQSNHFHQQNLNTPTGLSGSSYGIPHQTGIGQGQQYTSVPGAFNSNQPNNPGAFAQTSRPFNMDFSALNALLSAARNVGSPSRAATTQQPSSSAQPGSPAGFQLGSRINIGQGLSCYIFTRNPGPVMPRPELTSLLTEIQSNAYQQLASETRNIIGERVEQLLARKNPKEPQALEQTDEDIINLVALFFDQVLADNDIPPVMQSLICRLQIPVLRVALHERDFFDRPDHPARELINAITFSCVNFDDSKPIEKDPIYKKIVEIVQTVNTEYKQDTGVFARGKEELDALTEKERKKAWTVEQRTQQAEAGKSRMKQARIAAQSTIYKKLKDVELPEVVTEFLTRNWLQVMVITHLKHGAGTSEWVATDQAVTDLIWLCQNHSDSRSQQRRARLQPELMERLETGLEAAIDSSDIRRAKINALDDTITSIANKILSKETFTPLNEEHKDQLGRGENDDKPWEEMTAIEKQRSRYQTLTTEYYDKANDLSPGTWLHYFDAEQNKEIRCKLSAKMEGDTYIFVNRFGFKALEKTRKQLAYDLQFQRAKILDHNPIFDRIMFKVVGNLKN